MGLAASEDRRVEMRWNTRMHGPFTHFRIKVAPQIYTRISLSHSNYTLGNNLFSAEPARLAVGPAYINMDLQFSIKGLTEHNHIAILQRFRRPLHSTSGHN